VARFLYISGTRDEELLLAAEIGSWGQLKGRLTLLNGDPARSGEIRHRLGGKAPGEVATGEVATGAVLGTILGWRPEDLSLAHPWIACASRPGQGANRQIRRGRRTGSGYHRIAGALANLAHEVADQTVGNVLRRLDAVRFGAIAIFLHDRDTKRPGESSRQDTGPTGAKSTMLTQSRAENAEGARAGRGVILKHW
jgi:hypothetical protein